MDGSVVDDSDVPAMVLRLTPWRARDLAYVLAAYMRVVAVVLESSEISGTEETLSRALFDVVDMPRPS